jgi:hypothetical protein
LEEPLLDYEDFCLTGRLGNLACLEQDNRHSVILISSLLPFTLSHIGRLFLAILMTDYLPN